MTRPGWDRGATKVYCLWNGFWIFIYVEFGALWISGAPKVKNDLSSIWHDIWRGVKDRLFYFQFPDLLKRTHIEDEMEQEIESWNSD